MQCNRLIALRLSIVQILVRKCRAQAQRAPTPAPTGVLPCCGASDAAERKVLALWIRHRLHPALLTVPRALAPCSIFITHLRGDHCFGLATTLRLIDAAQVQAAAASAAKATAAETGASTSAEQFSDGATRGSSSRQGNSNRGRSLGQGLPVVPEVRVCGPPGLAQLVRVSCVCV